MQTRDEILEGVDRVHRDGMAYWSAFPAETFFAKIGEAWSPAENVRHLAKSVRPVAKALRMPRFMLWLMFGIPRRPSVTYDALRERYLGKLAAGADAGRFAPSSRVLTDRDAVLNELERANRDLRSGIVRWSDRALDRHHLPHPLLGKLTAREMLFFTLYHQLHHIEVVKKRLT
jgi:hypothetical protein